LSPYAGQRAWSFRRGEKNEKRKGIGRISGEIQTDILLYPNEEEGKGPSRHIEECGHRGARVPRRGPMNPFLARMKKKAQGTAISWEKERKLDSTYFFKKEGTCLSQREQRAGLFRSVRDRPGRKEEGEKKNHHIRYKKRRGGRLSAVSGQKEGKTSSDPGEPPKNSSSCQKKEGPVFRREEA